MKIKDDIMRRYEAGDTPAAIAKVYGTTLEAVLAILGLDYRDNIISTMRLGLDE